MLKDPDFLNTSIGETHLTISIIQTLFGFFNYML